MAVCREHGNRCRPVFLHQSALFHSLFCLERHSRCFGCFGHALGISSRCLVIEGRAPRRVVPSSPAVRGDSERRRQQDTHHTRAFSLRRGGHANQLELLRLSALRRTFAAASTNATVVISPRGQATHGWSNACGSVLLVALQQPRERERQSRPHDGEDNHRPLRH